MIDLLRMSELTTELVVCKSLVKNILSCDFQSETLISVTSARFVAKWFEATRDSKLEKKLFVEMLTTMFSC